MAIRNVRTDGDDVLRFVCKPVKEITDGTRKLIRDMFDTMYDQNGVGLAAPQIGVVKRIVVLDDYDGHKMALINPEIVESEGEQNSREGCLSIPGFSGFVKRPAKIRVKALDKDGNELDFTAEGFLACICCHEFDHLDGILYKDKAYEYGAVESEQ